MSRTRIPSTLLMTGTMIGCSVAAPAGPSALGGSAPPDRLSPAPMVATTPGPASVAPEIEVSPSPGALVAETRCPAIVPRPSGPCFCEGVPVSGTVFDDAGTPLAGATIRIKSLEASAPYEQTLTTCADGQWSVTLIPEGTYLELVVTKPGWTTRRRLGSYQRRPSGVRNVVDFGVRRNGRPTPEDPNGEAYFMSDRPEVELVQPGFDAEDVDPGVLAIKLRVSEPLDAAARAALAEAVVVYPAGGEYGGPAGQRVAPTASPSMAATPAPAVLDFGQVPLAPAIGYAIRAGSAFNGRRTAATWNEAGTELTLTLPGPLRAGREAPARYRVGLVAGTTPIRDASGLQLGTDGAGDLEAYPPPGRLIAGTFRLPWVDPEQMPRSGDLRQKWAATHATTADFAVRPDREPPVLVGASAYDLAGAAVLALRFSEPMAVFDGTPGGWTDPRLRGAAEGDGAPDDPGFMQRFSFALASQPEGLEVLRLDGRAGDEPIFDPTTGGEAPRDVEFALRPAALRLDGDLAAAAPGQVVIGVMPEDPRVVTLTFKARAGLFEGAGGVAVRVADVADPAGNVITHADADRQVVKAALRAAGEGR